MYDTYLHISTNKHISPVMHYLDCLQTYNICVVLVCVSTSFVWECLCSTSMQIHLSAQKFIPPFTTMYVRLYADPPQIDRLPTDTQALPHFTSLRSALLEAAQRRWTRCWALAGAAV